MPVDIGVFGARAIPSTYSGYETFLTTVLPELAARGHRVTMYCRAGEADNTEPYRGVQRKLLPAVPGKQFNTLSHGLVSAVAARGAGHDVVLVVNVANSLFCALNRYTGQPVVLNTDGQEWLRGKWGRLARNYFLMSAKVARRTATGLVADCAAMAEVYRSDFGAESTVIPYCFPKLDDFGRTGVLDRFGVRPGHYFVIAGRLNPENNIDRVAEAYSRSSLEDPLVVLGAANYRSPVVQRLRRISAIDPRVRVLGHVDDRSEFLDLISSARAYLHAHSVGGMNPSLVEAMRSGAYVAALDTPFNRETLGDAGTFWDFDDPKELGRVLGSVAGNSDASSVAERERARERATVSFGVQEVVDAYQRLIIAASRCSFRESVVLDTKWAVR